MGIQSQITCSKALLHPGLCQRKVKAAKYFNYPISRKISTKTPPFTAKPVGRRTIEVEKLRKVLLVSDVENVAFRSCLCQLETIGHHMQRRQ